MDWLSADYSNLGKILFGVVMSLLVFGWSAIFFYAASMLGKLKASVDGLHVSVTKLFERFNNQSEDLKEVKRRIDRLERAK